MVGVASFLPFLAYLFDNNRVKSTGFVWVRFSEFGARASGVVSRREEPQLGFGVFLRIPSPESRLFKSPVSIFEFPIQQSGREETNEFFRPTSIYPQHNKGLATEYFVRPKMAHPTENTGVVSCISFKCRTFNRLTPGCLESLQSESNLAIRKYQPSSFHFRLRALSPVRLRESRTPRPESRLLASLHVQFLRSRLRPLGPFLALPLVLTDRPHRVMSFCESPAPSPAFLFSQRTPNPGL